MATHSSILPGESCGQRRLTGYSPRGYKESDTTERLSTTQHSSIFLPGGLPRWLSGKEPACRCRRRGFEHWVGKIPWRKKRKVKSLSCVQICDSMDCSIQGSSVHGIFQARVLEWVAIALSRYEAINNNKSLDGTSWDQDGKELPQTLSLIIC